MQGCEYRSVQRSVPVDSEALGQNVAQCGCPYVDALPAFAKIQFGAEIFWKTAQQCVRIPRQQPEAAGRDFHGRRDLRSDDLSHLCRQEGAQASRSETGKTIVVIVPRLPLSQQAAGPCDRDPLDCCQINHASVPP